MIRLAAVICSLILCLNVSLASPDCLDNEELASTCGSYCFSALKPVLDYVKANQQQLDTCAKGTGPNLTEINRQLTDVKKTLDNFIQSLESREKYRSEREILLELLDTIENHLQEVLKEKDSLRNQINNIQNALSTKARVARKGDKIYIVGNQNPTKNCEKMGGKLASINIFNENIGFRKLDNVTQS